MNESEFVKIVDQTKSVVFSAANRYLNRQHNHLVDDVAQEVYFALYKQLKKRLINDLGSLSNYVYTMTKNECFRLNKKESLIETDEREIELASIEKSEGPIAEILEILETFPIKTRVPLQLFLAGFSLKEISQKLNMNMGTLKSHLFRGRNSLAKRYKEEMV